MDLSLWFCHFCPKFSVWEFEKRISEGSGNKEFNAQKIKEMGLDRYEGRWLSFQRLIPRILEDCLKHQIEIIYWGQPEYPPAFKRLSFPPTIIFVRGNKKKLFNTNVSIVGARHPTHLGRLWVQETVPRLVEEKIVIVSGGARGIDAEAHFATFQAKGETCAILPGGLDRFYPQGNRFIFERILEQGVIISEFPPKTDVRPENFHRRNRLIAGLSEIVVVVEAARRSGTLITAHRAVDENIDVLVVPGPAMVASYEGSLDLISQGAGLARGAQDILNVIKNKNSLKKGQCSPTLEP